MKLTQVTQATNIKRSSGVRLKAEDIYTAAGWMSMYQNGYLHGSPSRFSAESAIYTAAGCQHIIAICTAAVQDANLVIYMAAVCPHKIAIYTAAVQEPNRLYTRQQGVSIKLLYTRQQLQSKFRYIYIRLPCVHMKWLFTQQSFKSQIGYIHSCRVSL